MARSIFSGTLAKKRHKEWRNHVSFCHRATWSFEVEETASDSFFPHSGQSLVESQNHFRASAMLRASFVPPLLPPVPSVSPVPKVDNHQQVPGCVAGYVAVAAAARCQRVHPRRLRRWCRAAAKDEAENMMKQLLRRHLHWTYFKGRRLEKAKTYQKELDIGYSYGYWYYSFNIFQLSSMIWFFFVFFSFFFLFFPFCSEERINRAPIWKRGPHIGQVKARFAQWMQSSSITTSPNLDILPDAEGEGRCVVCTNDLEKGALICNESLGVKDIHKNNQTERSNAVGGNMKIHQVFYDVSRMLCWICMGLDFSLNQLSPNRIYHLSRPRWSFSSTSSHCSRICIHGCIRTGRTGSLGSLGRMVDASSPEFHSLGS